MKKARVPEKYRCQRPGRFCLYDCPHREPHTLRDNCVGEQGSCPGCIPIKPRWGGLPDNWGWWWWRAMPHTIPMPVFVDASAGPARNWQVRVPAGDMSKRCGLCLSPIGAEGRTVATMGGEWGRKVAD